MTLFNFCIGITNGLLLLAIGYFSFYYPPKKINWWYGYRTRRSMANQTIWNVANKLSAKMLIRLGWVLFILGIILAFFTTVLTAMIVQVFVLLLGIGIGMFWCETQLNKGFDKNGNPK